MVLTLSPPQWFIQTGSVTHLTDMFWFWSSGRFHPGRQQEPSLQRQVRSTQKWWDDQPAAQQATDTGEEIPHHLQVRLVIAVHGACRHLSACFGLHLFQHVCLWVRTMYASWPILWILLSWLDGQAGQNLRERDVKCFALKSGNLSPQAGAWNYRNGLGCIGDVSLWLSCLHCQKVRGCSQNLSPTVTDIPHRQVMLPAGGYCWANQSERKSGNCGCWYRLVTVFCPPPLWSCTKQQRMESQQETKLQQIHTPQGWLMLQQFLGSLRCG